MYSAIAANKRNTLLIMVVFMGLIAGLGWLFSAMYGDTGILWGTMIGAAIYVLIQYFVADKIALSVNGAKQITKADDPRLWRTVENLSITTGSPMPAVYIIDDTAMNAFATGRDPKHASVAATTGILQALDDSELEAVMAHELGHVRNYDIRVMMIVFGLVSAIGLLADLMLRMIWFRDDRENTHPAVMVIGIVAAILAPFVALLVQLAVSRQREYLADATGALTTRHPDALASALQKIAAHGSTLRTQNSSTAHLFFANPLRSGALSGMFSTHPPVEKRVARLQEMGSKF